MSGYLDLNKDKIKKSVISKLQILGYKVHDDTPIWEIQAFIKEIQRKNGLIMDGLIGIRTMLSLGYNSDEIKKLLKLPERTNKERTNRLFYYPFWLLF